MSSESCSECAVLLLRSPASTSLVLQVRQAQADKHSSIPAIPVTVRQLEAVIRISESIARMQLLPVATQEHVAKAIQLFNFSTMEAVKSGLHDNVVRRSTLSASGAVRQQGKFTDWALQPCAVQPALTMQAAVAAQRPGMRRQPHWHM